MENVDFRLDPDHEASILIDITFSNADDLHSHGTGSFLFYQNYEFLLDQPDNEKKVDVDLVAKQAPFLLKQSKENLFDFPFQFKS